MITPLTYIITTITLANKINEIIEHINGEPDIDEQIEKNEKLKELADLVKDLPDTSEIDVGEMQRIIEKNRRSPDPDCTTCNGTGVIEGSSQAKPHPCYCYKNKCDHPDCLICNECDEPIDDDRSEMFENLDNTDAAFENFDSRAYNIKLWTRDMRKMIKGKNISPKLKDDIRRKLNELEEL
jgi:hypothetical protein